MRTVVQFVDGRAFGGTEQVVLQLLQGLDRRRWQPVLFHHAEPGIAPLLDSARRLQVPARSLPRMNTLLDVPKMRTFISALRSERVAVLHAHLNWPLSCKYGIIAASLARVPTIVATAHLEMDISHRTLLRIQPRLIATRIDRYFAVSDAVAAQLRDQFRIPPAKICRINNGVCATAFERSLNPGLRKTLSPAAGRPIALTVASLEPRKGQRYLIEAAIQIPELILVLVGEGPDRAVLQHQARAAGVQDRVIFLGHRTDIPNLLACCDVFVLPSLAEGLPLSILEAMAAGKPVVASAIGGNSEVVIDGETGLLVPPGEPLALACAIRKLLMDTTLAVRLGASGRHRVRENYSAENMVRQTTEAYEAALGLPAPLPEVP